MENRYANYRTNQVGFVDLTLRLGLPPYHARNHNSSSNSNSLHLHQATMQNHDKDGIGLSGALSGDNNNNKNENKNMNNVGNDISNTYNQGGQYNINNQNLVGGVSSGFYLGHTNYGYNNYHNRVILRPARRPKRSGRRARTDDEDPSRRCSNFECKTSTTPMWRKGPLGPKTLCNACGIKYRKKEEKKEKEQRLASRR